MAKKLKKQVQARASGTMKRRKKIEIIDEEEQILREATIHLIRKHGMFLVATAARKASVKGFPVWIITMTLRCGVDDEAYIGDLLYDGDVFTFLTEQSVMDERARKIADDPERLRRWNEYRASTLQTARSVTFHDPRLPRISRKSRRLFQLAHRLLGSYSVVCGQP